MVPCAPDIIAAADASKEGMGGFWLISPTPANPIQQHFLWQSPFLSSIQSQLLTPDNPHDTLTSSDLELTALLVGATLAATSQPILHPHILIASDNIPGVSWVNKGSTTSRAAHAFLLHQLAQLRHANPFTLSAVFIPGSTKPLADCWSRSFHTMDSDFLIHLKSTYHMQPYWKLALPPTKLLTSLIGGYACFFVFSLKIME
jgi:hypothetical protein